MPFEVLEQSFAAIVRDGYGISQVNTLSAAIVGRIVDKLAQSPTFEGRPDGEQVDQALERIAYRTLVQRDWTEERAELAAAR